MTAAVAERLEMSRIVLRREKSEKKVGRTLRLPKEVWEKLDEVAQVSTEAAKEAGEETWSTNDVIEHFIAWALGQYETDKKRR